MYNSLFIHIILFYLKLYLFLLYYLYFYFIRFLRLPQLIIIFKSFEIFQWFQVGRNVGTFFSLFLSQSIIHVICWRSKKKLRVCKTTRSLCTIDQSACETLGSEEIQKVSQRTTDWDNKVILFLVPNTFKVETIFK